MKEITINSRGIMDEGCGTCSHCKCTDHGWECVFVEDENGNNIGTNGCKQAQNEYQRIRNYVH